MKRAKWILAAICVGIPACSKPPTPPPLPSPEMACLGKGITYLIGRQSPDGAWRGDVEAVLRPGPAMTALVMEAIQATAVRSKHSVILWKGLKYLESQVNADGIVGLRGEIADYPNYATSLAVIVLGREGKPVSKMVDYLKLAQLDEGEGWKPEDAEYGGWAFGGNPTEKYAFRLDMSSTRFALDALAAAGVPATDSAWSKARRYIDTVQNFKRDKRDDGGFFFTPLKPFQNKAGIEEETETTAYQFSYGSATADGLIALRLAGGSDDRISAARKWIEDRFTEKKCPGFKVDGNPPWQDGLKGYWLASVARAVPDRADWKKRIVQELMTTQRPDGSWINASVIMHENDPLLATALAVRALAECVR